jgi:hypothetical protein
MHRSASSHRTRTGAARRQLVVALLVAATVAIAIAWQLGLSGDGNRLLLAPMIGGLDLCMIEPHDQAAEHDAHLKQDCRRPEGSAAARVEATLAEIGPRFSRSGDYELGHTLHVPLLQLFRQRDGEWRIDEELVARFARTIRDAGRPVVLYLFGTHFSVRAPIEPWLARDAANLAATPGGPLAVDQYHGLEVYPWSVATTANEITRRRLEAIEAVARAVCDLWWWQRRRIRAVTLLGEVHQLFPAFETGMGFAPPYAVTDYSEASRKGFRAFLGERFQTIAALNEHLGSSFGDFSEVDPPAKDIRTEALRHFWEHIDSFAHGELPVSGWARSSGGTTPVWIRIYLNGRQVGRVKADLGRQDVAAVHPEFGTANVGWRFDLRFRDLPHGIHRVEVVAEFEDSALMLLGSRRFVHVDRTQAAVKDIPSEPLPGVQPADARIKASIDMPADLASVFFNPLAPLWHEFRAQQVARYLSFIAGQLQGTCLAEKPTYIHQIAPFVNPSWDATKYAVDASLRPIEGLRLGISLYGESTFGRSFFDWYTQESGHRTYGVTEFHPLRAMKADELRRTLERHRAHGAKFLSFFVDGLPRRPVGEAQSIFVYTTFNPDVRAFGSDRLFRSVQEIMQR